MAFLSTKQLGQLRDELGWAKPPWVRLLRVISIHLNYPKNRIGLEGHQEHGPAWDIWFDGFLGGPMLDEGWAMGKQHFWDMAKAKDVEKVKLLLRTTVVVAARSVRSYQRRGFFPGWMNNPTGGSNSEHSVPLVGDHADEQDSNAGDSSIATEKDPGEEESITMDIGGENTQQNTPQELKPSSTREWTMSLDQKARKPYRFSFRPDEDGPAAYKFPPQNVEPMPPRKRRKTEPNYSSNQNQAITTDEISPVRNYGQENTSAIKETSLSSTVRRQPFTFVTRMQIPNTDVIRQEHIDINSIIPLAEFVKILRTVHGMLGAQQIGYLDVGFPERHVHVSAASEDGEWKWGLVLGIIHFSGISEHMATVDLIMM